MDLHKAIPLLVRGDGSVSNRHVKPRIGGCDLRRLTIELEDDNSRGACFTIEFLQPFARHIDVLAADEHIGV